MYQDIRGITMIYHANDTHATRDATNKTEVHFLISFHLVCQASPSLSSNKVVLSCAPSGWDRGGTGSLSGGIATCCDGSGGCTLSKTVRALSWVGGNTSA